MVLLDASGKNGYGRKTEQFDSCHMEFRRDGRWRGERIPPGRGYGMETDQKAAEFW